MNILFFDTETTGVGKDDNIVEIGYVLYNSTHDQIITCGQTLIPTEKPPANITGISKEACELADKSHKLSLALFIRCVEMCDIYCAHNLDFDKRFTEDMLNRNQNATPVCTHKDIDYEKAGKEHNVRISSKRLTHLCADFNVVVNGAHSALHDTLMLLQLSKNFIDQFECIHNNKKKGLLRYEITLNIPYQDKETREIIKENGFKFNGTTKKWSKISKFGKKEEILSELNSYLPNQKYIHEIKNV